MSRKRLFAISSGGILLLALAIFLLGRFGVVPFPWSPGADALASEKENEGDDEERVPVPVELARAGTRPIAAFYRASSVVEANRQVGLVARRAGRVQEVRVEEGDWVESGRVLARLENDRERIRLRQEELRVEEQRRDLERSESLLEQSLITRDNFDGARSAFELAEAERDLAAVALEETLVRAPFDGQVTQRFVVPGQHIEPSHALFTLVDFTPLRARISLPETIARRIRAGDIVQISTDNLSGAVPARVERVSPVVDPGTSTVRITLLVAEGGKELRVGGFVKVRITTDTHAEALSVPKIALVEEGSLRSVFVVEADSVRKVEVQTGLHDETHAEVLDGLREGDFVVSLGQGGLRTGSHVDVLNASEVGWVRPDSAETAAAPADAGEPEG